jgi:endonuclease/exonuclease/phosphatase family metal-dependent hydrolase
LLNAKVLINDSTAVNTISLHHLPTLQGIPNTADYLKKLSDPIILMGDFNYSGEITDFINIGLTDVDSTYEEFWIDRIFYSKNYFQSLEFGTLEDSIGVSDHLANYGVIKLKK